MEDDAGIKKKKKKPHKQNAEKCEIDGFKFPSKAEGEYYLKLKADLENKGIKGFEMQPRFIIQDKFKHHIFGNIGAITYTPDFKVTFLCGYVQYVDVKGMPTSTAINSRKMFLKRYPELDLKWVSKSKKHSGSGWIDYFDLKRIRRENKKKKAKLKENKN